MAVSAEVYTSGVSGKEMYDLRMYDLFEDFWDWAIGADGLRTEAVGQGKS